MLPTSSQQAFIQEFVETAMDMPRFTRTVCRVTMLSRDEGGNVVPVVLFRRGKKSKKGSRGLRAVERLTRRWTEATNSATDRYLSRHKKSNRKRKDGWLRDVNLNVTRAGQKGWKKLDLGGLFGR
jgi:Family of unknown function (DUF6312)